MSIQNSPVLGKNVENEEDRACLQEGQRSKTSGLADTKGRIQEIFGRLRNGLQINNDTRENVEHGTTENSICIGRGVSVPNWTSRLDLGPEKESKLSNTKEETDKDRARVVIWVLGVVVFLLLIILISLAACWPRQPSLGELCSTPECLRLAAMYSERMRPEVDVCEWPREWACGGWLQDNAARLPGRSSWSLQEEIRLQELTKLRDIISTMPSVNNIESIEWRVVTLFESCMALDILEGEDYHPLIKIINELGGWHVNRDWSSRAWSWRQALESLVSRYGVSPLFSASVAWSGNSTILHLRPAGLGLPNPAFYQAPPDSKPVRAYKALLKDAALSLDASTLAASRFADDMFAFEKRLADLLLGEGGEETERVMTLKEINENSVHLPFQGILHAMFPDIRLGDDTAVLVSSPHYINYLLSVTTSTSPSVLNDYFTWTLIREYLPYMSKTFRLIWREYLSHISGSTEEPPRWEFCASLVQKITPLGTLAILEHNKQRVYTRNDTESVQRAAVHKIFELIKQTAKEAVVSSNIDEQIKTSMLEQLSGLKFQIGLKTEERSSDFLLSYHKGFSVQKHNLFQNIEYALDFERDLVQRAYNNKDVNIVRDNAKKLLLAEASYNSHTKTVILPEALATTPYFHSEYPRYVQYARVGVTIGTAIARALAATDPGSHKDVPRYVSSSIRCLTDLLHDTIHANLTTPSMVASSISIRIIGVTFALNAAHNGKGDTILPQLEQFHGDRLFALSYAQTLCSIHTPAQALLDGIDQKIDGETMFNMAWPQVRGIQNALQCTSHNVECPKPFDA